MASHIRILSLFNPEILDYFFHHVFLPAKVPNEDDDCPENQRGLVGMVSYFLKRFLSETCPDDAIVIQDCIKMMNTLRKSIDLQGGLDESEVEQALQQLSTNGDAVAFHVAAQNAGVLVRKMASSVCFETFELSPTNAAVMTTRGRLVREFPASAIEISDEDFKCSEFQAVVAKTLVKMSHQAIQEMKPKTRKAGKEHDEDRDTTDPRIVTELFTSILRGAGKEASVSGIRKNTREEVMWSSGNLPWRRSPLWLLVRVALQLTMFRATGNSENLYKPFMVFLMAQVLEAGNRARFSSDRLHMMLSKISKRCCKLRNARTGKWLETVERIVSQSSEILNSRWKGIRQRDEGSIDLKTIAGLTIEESTYFSLSAMEGFLASIPSRIEGTYSPGFTPVTQVRLLEARILPSVDFETSNKYLPFRLLMFEDWVANSLDDWFKEHIQRESTCHDLAKLIQMYHSPAKKWYSNHPEGASRMLLTVGELWIAVDKAAICAIPMLEEYDPEVPSEVWQALLLSSAEDMERLHRLETYILNRKKIAMDHSLPSVFRSYGMKSSFPVRYFSHSAPHHELKQRIENDAALERAAKVAEYRRMKREHDDLMQQHEVSSCDYVKEVRYGLTFSNHYDYACHRCRLLERAKQMTISVHEWPLPKDLYKAQTTVFELAVPKTFAEWRDATIDLIDTVLLCEPAEQQCPEQSYPLRRYECVSKYVQSSSRRIHLVSGTMPHLATHWKNISIRSSSEDQVCVNNGLQYQYYDEKQSCFLSEFSPSIDISILCTFKLPKRAQALKPFLLRPWSNPNGETPNKTIASLSCCPDYMPLGEFKALSVLPYGFNIRWMSILRELAMPTIDFNKAETAIFLLQMSLQAGPYLKTNTSRWAHVLPSDLSFGHKILENLETSIARVEENWKSHVALCSFTFLATRLLSLVCEQLDASFISLLEQCRGASYRWLMKLIDKVQETTDETQRVELSKITLTVALICVDSFHVEKEYMRKMLKDPEQASMLVEASIIIHNNSTLRNTTEHKIQDILFARWQHTMHCAREMFIIEIRLMRTSCFDIAVQSRWPAFERSSCWSVAKPTCYWFKTFSGRLQVHLNILTGSLLVDGLPLSRLPRDHEEHHDYRRLFGSLVLEVMPSSAPGMRFSTTKRFHGYTVHFGMQDCPGSSSCRDLLVHLEDEDSTLDFIPPHNIKGILPHTFVDEYAHWYDNDTGIIEFRSHENPWESSPDNWRLSRQGKSWKLGRSQRQLLLAPSSMLAQRISRILSPLEEPLSIHMVSSENIKSLEVRVPRLHLDFLLDSETGTLQSKQYRGLQIDADQSIGTLIGLTSKLVLRSQNGETPRMLLVPQGNAQYRTMSNPDSDDHVNVSVAFGSARRVQAYQIDNVLGRLVSNDKIENKLFLAYLHALTSFCLPDPFLKRTGTEQALQILHSACIRAPCHLTQAAHNTLGLIADISPGRSFYPSHARVMQIVTWSPILSSQAQDDRFYKTTREIIARSSEIDFFYPENGVTPANPTHAEMQLVERAILRSSGQHVFGFGAEDVTNAYDVIYDRRDYGWSERGIRAAEMAFRIYNDKHSLLQDVSPLFAERVYDKMRYEKISSFRSFPSQNIIEYDSRWLQSPATATSSCWYQIHYAFQCEQRWLNKFQLMFWMSTMSYSAEYDEQITQAILMLSLAPSVSAVSLPHERFYALNEGYQVQKNRLEKFAGAETRSLDECPEGRLTARHYESAEETLRRRRYEFELQQNDAISSFSRYLAMQWPCDTPNQPVADGVRTYIDVAAAMKNVYSSWTIWWQNLHFKNYLEELASSLRDIPVETVTLEHCILNPTYEKTKYSVGFISVDDLFRDIPPSRPPALRPMKKLVQETATSARISTNLTHVLTFLDSRANLEFEHQYLRELRRSIISLQKRAVKELNKSECSLQLVLFRKHLAQCESRVTTIYNRLSSALRPKNITGSGTSRGIESIIAAAGFLPRISPLLLLQQLRCSRWSELSDVWQQAIVDYALAISALQKAKRLIRSQDDPVDLLRELENTGRQGWSPHDYPEWLLLECESEIMIRGVQQQIAQQMIQPPDYRNAVMQLNMGEGKSSVIVPIVAAALGNGLNLVRVIVAKPQAKQMYQTLMSKIAGLLDRPVYQLPFSRDIRMGKDRAGLICRLMKQCMEEGGVLMVQPEHLLSFQLMELECHINSQEAVANTITEVRELFDKSSTDLVDESDENFSVKFELIYTLGQQQSIEHSPDRWTIIQEILGLVRHFCSRAKQEFPKSMEFDDRDGAKFPKIRILRPDAEEAIFNRVAHNVCEKGMAGFPISHQPPGVRDAIFRYITLWELSPTEIQAVEKGPFWVDTTKNHILLLRGLFSGGILAFSLGQKRWRVNYGIDPTRETKTKLAVPFRAKDSPTPRSEFSHPDVVITLTCLSYYYGGLDNDALFSALGLLLRSDNSAQEYHTWVETAPTLPQAFRHLQGINLQDRIQCTAEVFPHLRYSKAAIDYYLCRMVFAKEAKEFPHKLSASGWDLGKRKCNPTTGFSGTNDSRYVLPLDMKQLDLEEQKHTNALVLEYLLRPENGISLMPQDMDGTTFESESLLRMVSNLNSNTRVILDVGAQVIDLNNLEFSRKWLSCHKEEHTQAVIFFNDMDELVVLDRSGKLEDLQSSPFADQLDQCLVFLDEAHTRGTDLKLPANYRAAVTLGAYLTKDRLVQACMRMRKLGKGQTVVFCIPREIEQKIIQLRKPDNSATNQITLSDILCWVITETCLDLRRAVPLWLSQGTRFYQQQRLWDMLGLPNWGEKRGAFARDFMEEEAQSISTRYRPQNAHSGISSLLERVGSPIAEVFDCRCRDFGLTELRACSLQEEQERELSPETEQERQIEKPPPAKPATHSLYPSLVTLVTTGVFATGSRAFNPAFESLSDTSAAAHFNTSEFRGQVWVTRDFSKTVTAKFGSASFSDSFQRPVQWILTHKSKSKTVCLVIISPYEAQHLLPQIQNSPYVALHLYAPRVNLGLMSLDQLDLYSVSKGASKTIVPRDVVAHLNLFAGQLYLSSFSDYTNLCDVLGLAWMPADESVSLGPDGFIPPGYKHGNFSNKSGFSKSPVRFLKVLMSKIRQECEGIEKTHVGKILKGERLHESEFTKAM